VQANSRITEALAAFRRGDLVRARVLATAQLDAERGPPDVHHLLGLIDCREGRLETGVKHLRDALDSEPDNAAFRVMLARALVDSGRVQDALAVAAPQTGTSAAEIALWHVRAEAAQSIGRYEVAAEAWNVLCAARPDDWRAWANYGDSLARLGNWNEAARTFRRALQLNPGEVPLRRKLATALARAGRYDESADEFKRWVEASPDDAANRIAFARLLADLGRYGEALDQLDAAAQLTTGQDASIESGPSLLKIASGASNSSGVNLPTLKELAFLLERTNRMDALRELLDEAERVGIRREQLAFPAASSALRQGDAAKAKLLLLSESPDSDPPRWHWLMARITDALGMPDTAFAEAEKMNRSVNDYDKWRERAARHLQLLRGLAETVTPEWSRGITALEPGERRNPSFVVGFPRSGTTLLDTFLMGHPGTAVLEEIPLIRAIERELGSISALPQCSIRELEAARHAYFAELGEHVDPAFSGLVVDKLPLNMLALPFLNAVFPDARIVFVQRHPCDCVLSCFMQAFALNDSMACFLDIRDAAEFYDAAMTVWIRSCDALRPRVQTLVYEDLVTDPEAALRPVVEHLGLEWKRELLDHRATAERRGAISTPSYSQLMKPVNRQAVGRWRHYRKQLEPYLPILLSWAERLGYADQPFQ